MKNEYPKIVVISGGSLGLGKELVTLFSENGDTVISLSRSNPSEYKNHIACDVSCKESVDAAA